MPPAFPAQVAQKCDSQLQLRLQTALPATSWIVAVSTSVLIPIRTSWPGVTPLRSVDGRRFFSVTATTTGVLSLATDIQIVSLVWSDDPEPVRKEPMTNPGLGIADAGAARVIGVAKKAVPDEATISHTPEIERDCIAIIDNGIPFAHEFARFPLGGSRFLAYWDQNVDSYLPSFAGLGAVPTGHSNGTVLDRADIDALLAMACASGGSLDERLCYDIAGARTLRRHRTHGAHALGLLAGYSRVTGRGFGHAPNLDTSGDRAAKADLIGVQLPAPVLGFIAPGALGRYVLDAMDFIVSTAQAAGHKKVTIALAYEYWMGPHDGSGWLEAAIDEQIIDLAPTFELSVFVVAGNSKAARAHYEVPQAQTSTILHWHVLPSGEVPARMEIWFPSLLDDLQLDIKSPDGVITTHWTLGDPILALPSLTNRKLSVVEIASGSSGSVALEIAETLNWANPGACAPAGEWRIKLSRTAGQALSGVHAYIGRSVESFGSARRAKQSYFAHVETPQKGGAVSGTINGHATGARAKVIGAYRHAKYGSVDLRDTLANYSAEGPARNGRNPDLSVAVEDSVFLSGVLASGVRSATVFRLTGTSTACPLAARHAIDAATFPNVLVAAQLDPYP